MERRVVLLGGTGFIGRAYAWRCAAHGLSQQAHDPHALAGARRKSAAVVRA